MSAAKIGLVINPIAGMGGRVGLKGTDGLAEEARRRGAKPVATHRTAEMLKHLDGDIFFLTASGDMGENALKETKFPYEISYYAEGETAAEDTKKAVESFIKEGAELVVFCGGDGTARDVFSVTGDRVPILGVPAGVKMHSSVFAVNPEAAARIIREFAENRAEMGEGEVMDIDEEEYREGRLAARLYGIARVPSIPNGLQGTKESYGSGGAEQEKEEIAHYIAEMMNENRDTTFVLGAGTTLAAIGRALGVEKTLLGVDIWRNGVLVAKDTSEREILDNLTEESRIVITVIGNQGFLFGRGNQQISPEVIRRVGIKNIIIVATPTKLKSTPVLRVDTGDPELDEEMRGYARVITGYGRARMVKIE